MNDTIIVHVGVPHDISICRPGKWENPYIIGKDGTRAEVIAKFEKHVRESDLINDIEELRGKVLGCFCPPKPCHGDVLIKILDENPLTEFFDE
jgi:hypothetical protein